VAEVWGRYAGPPPPSTLLRSATARLIDVGELGVFFCVMLGVLEVRRLHIVGGFIGSCLGVRELYTLVLALA
jgi:hypothetical protein